MTFLDIAFLLVLFGLIGFLDKVLGKLVAVASALDTFCPPIRATFNSKPLSSKPSLSIKRRTLFLTHEVSSALIWNEAIRST